MFDGQAVLEPIPRWAIAVVVGTLLAGVAFLVRSGDARYQREQATVESFSVDGLDLRLHYTGGGCTGDASASVEESRDHVALELAVDRQVTGDCEDVGEERFEVVTLRQPLGERIVLDRGRPVGSEQTP
jgi:hypothetical protein